MRRLPRFILNTLTALSALLALALLLLWPRSHSTCDQAVLTYLNPRPAATDLFGQPRRPGWRLELVSLNGGLGMQWTPYEGKWLRTGDPGVDLWRKSERIADGGWQHPDTAYPNASRNLRQGYALDPLTNSWTWRWHNFFVIKTRAPNPPEFAATVPHWAVAAVFSLLPTARLTTRLLRRWRAHRRRRAGRCPACNYDLRASADRCPECGAEVARPSRP